MKTKQVRLSKQQRSFLRVMREDIITLETLVARFSLEPGQLGRWLRSRGFRLALASTLRELRRRRQLELELGSMQGARKLSSLLTSNDMNIARLAAINVVSLARVAQRVLEDCRRYKRKAAFSRGSSASLIHPDVSRAEAAQLLAEMNAAE